MSENHIPIHKLPYCRKVKKWLTERYGKSKAEEIWRKTVIQYNEYIAEAPDYGGKNTGHATAIYGGMLVFALYPSLPDEPPVPELEPLVRDMFMSSFTRIGKILDLNRPSDMRLIGSIFQKVGDRDRKDAAKYPAGFMTVNEPYDKERHAARYRFTQCPNAEFAKKHELMHVLPVLCNTDFFGISELHGTLIRPCTCGNSDICDYTVVGNKNPIAAEYDIVTDDGGFLVSRKKGGSI